MWRTVWTRGASVLLAVVVIGCSGEPATPDPAGSPSVAPSSVAASPTVAPTPGSSPSTSAPDATTTVQVFLSNSERGDPCEEVFGVPRQVPAAAPLRGALEALLAGPTPGEVEAAYGGWFTAETAGMLRSVRVEDGIALVDLDPRLPEVIPNASSSCGSTALLAALDATVMQFPDVEEGRYGLDGDRVAFYSWLQRAAPGDEPPPQLPTEPAQPSEPDGPTEPDTPDAPDAPDETLPPPTARSVPEGLVATEWTSLPTGDRVVALTFDGGANADGADAILTTLAETGTPATFFLTGRFTIAYPRFAAVIGASHPVGNHTQNHPDLTELSDAEVRTEVSTAHDGITAAAGRDPRPWFRFPYGARDQRTIDLVNDLDYGAVRWTTDTLGWQGTSGGISVDAIVARVLGDLGPGQVVLLHLGSNPDDGSTLDADALPTLISRIRAAGYDFVDLDHMLSD